MGNTSEKALFFSETQVERSINKEKILFALFVLEKEEEETSLYPLAQPLIHEFGDVFIADLPLGLPRLEGLSTRFICALEPLSLTSRPIGVITLEPRCFNAKFKSSLTGLIL